MNGQDGRQLLMARIVREQVGRISAEFASQQGTTVEIVSSANGAAFMYAADQLLVREQDAQRVHSVLRESVRAAEPEDVIPGIKLLRFDAAAPYSRRPTVPMLLEQIDERFRETLAAPNHVVTVAPEAGPCPATEPEEVYFDIEPFPGVRMEDDGSDGNGVRVYVADTGLLSDTTSHSWLEGVLGEPDPLEPRLGELIKPYAGHGTFVAGVLRCMAPKADVFVSNAFRIAGSALESDFVKDLTAALNQGVDIFNLSVTTPSRNDLRLLGFEAWLQLLHQHPGVVCVVAAGNDGKQGKFWPAAFPEMVSVGALTANWRNRANFSNYGDWVKVYAPGRNLVNAYATGTYECRDAPYEGQRREFFGMADWSGTSFSTPLVAGLIAARKSRTGETARQAADSLLADAQSQAIPHVGPVLLPYDNTFKI
jgi:subtilisin family serine protease